MKINVAELLDQSIVKSIHEMFSRNHRAAKALLHRLVEEKPKVLVQDWFKDLQS